MGMYKKMGKKNLPEEVANQIQSLIRQGQFKPGQQLPGERELAEYLEVNRSTVREALRILEVMRMVDIRQGEGTFVVSEESSSIESLVFRFLCEDGLDLESLRDVFEAVLYLEGVMTKLAAQRISEKEAQQLLAMAEQTDRFYPAGWDRHFHLAISRAAKSNVLYRIDHTIWIIMEKYAGVLFEKPGALETSQEHHRRLAELIASHRDEEASRLMQEHLLWARGQVFPYY